jgi:hypothetical protein
MSINKEIRLQRMKGDVGMKNFHVYGGGLVLMQSL